MIRSFVACLFALALAACSALPPSTGAAPDPAARSVVLVSLDGFRPVDLGRGWTPNLDALARDGVRAEAMRPSYPTLTFPNHYTIVTGLRPDRHGIVHNTMRDATLGTFTISNDQATQDPRWWDAAEPLWVTVEKSGLRSATMFWPGSSAPIHGVRPTEWRAYDETFPAAARTDVALEWLSRPAPTRPRFVTLYFEHVDEASHDHGPGSPEAVAAIRDMDAQIGRLRAGIAARGLTGQVDIVIVSDHGLASVPPPNRLAVEDMVPPEVAQMITDGQSVGFQPQPGREAEARRVLVGRHEHYRCWPREDLPPQWHYGRHPRVPPIVCQMDEGWDAYTRARIAANPRTHMRGSHGYDPALPSMAALFVAGGPSFREGVVLPAFDNVDVYPLLARLAGVTPRPNDGDPSTFAPALRESR